MIALLPYYTVGLNLGLRLALNKFSKIYLRPMDALLHKLDEIYCLPEPLRSEFAAAWHPLVYPKGHTLLREGAVNHSLYFISTGIARLYYHKQNREVTEWIAMDGTFFFSIRSFFERKPSQIAIHLLEPATLFALDHNELMRLCDQHHAVEKLFRHMLTGSLLLSQIRMESIQFETAQQRYQGLLARNPDIVQRVPLAYIASFLGITQETLSRVRGAK